ncbi:MAG: copper resistance protein CopC [Acidobacteria bacterium]|nr:copper resistance protein CopC [Acidobacteriota bacterium]
MALRSICKIALAFPILASACAGLLAHATLLRTVPPSNARVDQLPQRVELFFNEAIEPVFNSLRVFNRNGLRVDSGDAALSRNGREMSVLLKENLPNGIYTVDWRATSSDGHQIGGHFGFSLGEEFEASALAGIAPGSMQSLPAPAMAVVRWLYFVSVALFAGWFAFTRLVFIPSIKRARTLPADVFSRVRRTLVRLALWSWIAVLVTSVVNLLFKAAAMADSSLLGAADVSILRGVTSLTRYGQMWMAGMGVTLLAGIVLGLYARSRVAAEQPAKHAILLWLGALLSALFLLTVSNSGHAAAVNEWREVAVGADALHLMATAVWVGGLIYLILLIRMLSHVESEARARFMGEVVPRFSRMALYSVAIIVATGVYTAWLHMPSWSSFLTTLYGKTLLAKLILVTPLLVIGAVNLLVIKPQLKNHLLQTGQKALEGALAVLKRFRPLVQTEVILGVVILFVVTILTNVPPAATSGPAGPVLTANETDFEVSLKVHPNQIGHNQVEVVVQDKEGQAVSDLASLILVISMVDMDMGTERIEAEVQPDGSYQAEVVLGMAGTWEIDVRMMEKGSSDQKAVTFQTTIP